MSLYQNEPSRRVLSYLNSLDTKLYQLINMSALDPSFDQLMLAISGRLVWLVPGILLFLLALLRRNKSIISFCLMVGLTLGVTDLVTYQVLKPAFHRERPCHQEIEHRLVPSRCGSDWGFPSNHGANGMALAVSAAWQTPHPVVWGLVLLTLAVGYSRVHLGVHFPGDVLAGFLVGALLATVVYWAVRLIFRRFGREHWICSRAPRCSAEGKNAGEASTGVGGDLALPNRSERS